MMRYYREKNSRETTVIHFSVDGQEYAALEGDTIASALYAAGVRAWRRAHASELRGLFCGIGHCFDCLVTVNGVPNIRACQTLVEPGMVILTNVHNRE